MRNSLETIREGMRVTLQPETWWDGEPVRPWPIPSMVGTVKALRNNRGVVYATVEYANGKRETITARSLFFVGQ